MLKCWQVTLRAKSHKSFTPSSPGNTLAKDKKVAAMPKDVLLVSVHALCWRLATFTLCCGFTFTFASCSLAPPFLSLNASKIRIHTSIIIDGEGVIFPHNSNAHILVGQINLIGQGVPQCPQAVLHHPLQPSPPNVIPLHLRQLLFGPSPS